MNWRRKEDAKIDNKYSADQFLSPVALAPCHAAAFQNPTHIYIPLRGRTCVCCPFRNQARIYTLCWIGAIYPSFSLTLPATLCFCWSNKTEHTYEKKKKKDEGKKMYLLNGSINKRAGKICEALISEGWWQSATDKVAAIQINSKQDRQVNSPLIFIPREARVSVTVPHKLLLCAEEKAVCLSFCLLHKWIGWQMISVACYHFQKPLENGGSSTSTWCVNIFCVRRVLQGCYIDQC